MTRFLITGARAPAAMDLARRLARAGHHVDLCDSLRFPVSRFTRYRQRWFRVPAANDTNRFMEAVNCIVRVRKTDVIIPTCEECFFLSSNADRISTRVFVDDIRLMKRLHDKFEFASGFGNDFAFAPQTELLTCQHQIESLGGRLADWVFKPVFSRFATKTLIGPTAERARKICITPLQPWVAQKRIRGTEISCYAIANRGQLIGCSTYRCPYRVGIGAGIYFEPIESPNVAKFLAQFLRETNYTGQIGFDFILDSDSKLWVIEANPRCTSGFHLLPSDIDIAAAISDTQYVGTYDCSPRTAVRMVSPAMMTWGILQSLQSFSPIKWFRDFVRAKDVVFDWRDPFPLAGVNLAFAELVFQAIRHRRSLQAMSTEDMEWNGSFLD